MTIEPYRENYKNGPTALDLWCSHRLEHHSSVSIADWTVSLYLSSSSYLESDHANGSPTSSRPT